MKVVFILPNLGAGGAERVVTNLAGALAAKDIQVDIMLMLDDIVQYAVPDNVALIKLNLKEQPRFTRLQSIRSYFHKQKQAYKRIVAIPFHDSCLNYVLASTLGMGITVVACERNDPYKKGSSFIKRIKANVPYVLASRCIFQTNDAKGYYGRLVQQKATVIANPINTDDLPRWNGGGKMQIVSVGRLEPQKNQKLLIDAFAKIHKKHQNATLIIYGEGSLRKRLQQQIEDLKLCDYIVLAGYVSDIKNKLAAGDIFVLSSDYEGMSNALIEAMAIGMPVISSDHPPGGARMLICDGRNGMLFPVGNEDELCCCLDRLLSDAEYAQELGRRAVYLRDVLSIERVVKLWMEAIEE